MIPLPEETKFCPRCECSLPLSEYGIDRSKRDGINIYCKSCIRAKVGIYRESIRQYKAARPKRKHCARSKPIWRMSITNKKKAELAYQKGITDRVAIQRETRISWDELTDIIADLNESNTIRWNRKRREFQYAA